MFTLLVRTFEHSMEGKGEKLAKPRINDIWMLYKHMPHRNTHVTSAMIKAWGKCQSYTNVEKYMQEYRSLAKTETNGKFGFLVYQAALDAAWRGEQVSADAKVKLRRQEIPYFAPPRKNFIPLFYGVSEIYLRPHKIPMRISSCQSIFGLSIAS